MFKIKVFPVQLANQSLLLYWGLDGPKAFNQYLNRNMLMIFGKGWSLEKRHQIPVKYMHFSDVLFRIKKIPSAISQTKAFTVLRQW